MSKPYSDEDFCAQIIDDRTWRIKEISDLKSAAQRADGKLQRVLLRSLVTICYAHWEGYIKFAAGKYLEHVAMRRLSYRELNRQFTRNHFIPKLSAFSNSKQSIAERCRFIDEVLDYESKRFSRVNDDLVNTKANLNHEVFYDICKICDVDVKFFDGNATFIDIILLKRRNAIAHGEETFIAAIDADETAQGVVSLMRGFGDALENLVVLKQYRAS